MIKPAWCAEESFKYRQGDKSSSSIGQFLERGAGPLELCRALVPEAGPMKTISPIGTNCAVLMSSEAEAAEVELALRGGSVCLSEVLPGFGQVPLQAAVKSRGEVQFAGLAAQLDNISYYREVKRLLTKEERDIEAGMKLWFARKAPLSLAPVVIAAHAQTMQVPQDLDRIRKVLRRAGDVKDAHTSKRLRYRDSAYFGLIQLCCSLPTVQLQLLEDLVAEMEALNIRDTWSAKMLINEMRHEGVKMGREARGFCVDVTLRHGGHAAAVP